MKPRQLATRLSILAMSMMVATSYAKQQTQGDTSFTIGEVITVKGHRFIDASRALTSVDRISGDVAQEADIDYAWELVGKLPGVLLTEFNQGTSSGKLSFRGFNGEGEVNAVKLLIDGVPSNTNDGNMPFIDMLFPVDIEAVEVIRGTTDPRYGLNNIAGNVSFATRSGDNYVETKLTAGSFDTYEGQFALGIEEGDLRQNYSLSHRSKNGYRDHATLERSGISAKWGYDLSADLILTASARHYESEADEPGYLTAELAYKTPKVSNEYNETDTGTRDMQQFSLGLQSSEQGSSSFNILTWLNKYEDDRFVKFSENYAQQNRYSEEKHYGLITSYSVTPDVDAVNALHIEVGASYEAQDVISKRFYTEQRVPTSQFRDQEYDINVSGAYIQLVVEPTEWLRITPAFRADWVEGDFKNNLSGTHAKANDYGTIKQPKISVAVMPTQATTLFANWGRTFQIGTNSGAYLIPPRQTDLDPSVNDGWETGIKYSANDIELRLTYWEQSATDEFKRKLNDPLGDFDNLGATDRDGVDVQISWTATQALSLWTAMAWQNAAIATPDPSTPELKGNDIDHIPDQIFSAGIDYQLTEKVKLTSTFRAQSDYEITTGNEHGRFGDFTLLDIDIKYAYSDNISLSAQLHNITDDYYEYVWWDGSQTLHSPGEGRLFTASITMKY